MLSGALDFGGGPLLKALRARLGIGRDADDGDGFLPVERVRREAGEAADGLYLAFPSLLPAAGDLTPAARRFVRGVRRGRRRGRRPGGGAGDRDGAGGDRPLGRHARLGAARAAGDAKRRAASSARFSFDRYGDITPAPFTILRVTDEVPAGGQPIEGAVVDRVIEVPTG